MGGIAGWVLLSPPYDPGEEWYNSVLTEIEDGVTAIGDVGNLLIVGLGVLVFLLAVHVVGSWGR